MQAIRRPLPFRLRRRLGVKNFAPWTTIFQHTFHQFHENDLFTPAAAMSYFGLLTLFPALLVMLVWEVNLGFTATLIALWFTGTIGTLGLILWRAHRQGESAHVGLLWDERAD